MFACLFVRLFVCAYVRARVFVCVCVITQRTSTSSGSRHCPRTWLRRQCSWTGRAGVGQSAAAGCGAAAAPCVVLGPCNDDDDGGDVCACVRACVCVRVCVICQPGVCIAVVCFVKCMRGLCTNTNTNTNQTQSQTQTQIQTQTQAHKWVDVPVLEDVVEDIIIQRAVGTQKNAEAEQQ